jgi:hypothetical protein
LDGLGNVSWIQLETALGLRALAVRAELVGDTPAGLQDNREGRRLADLELRQALGRSQPVELNTAFTVGEDAGLLGALFAVEPSYCPDVANSYANWLARQERRDVRG